MSISLVILVADMTTTHRLYLVGNDVDTACLQPTVKNRSKADIDKSCMGRKYILLFLNLW